MRGPRWTEVWTEQQYATVGASQAAQWLKNLPANAGDIRDEGSVPGWEDPLEEGKAPHSTLLAWKIPWTEEPDGLVHKMAKSRI